MHGLRSNISQLIRIVPIKQRSRLFQSLAFRFDNVEVDEDELYEEPDVVDDLQTFVSDS